VKKSEAIAIIQAEINWHRKHMRAPGISVVFKMAFMLGLRQARDLIKNIPRSDR